MFVRSCTASVVRTFAPPLSRLAAVVGVAMILGPAAYAQEADTERTARKREPIVFTVDVAEDLAGKFVPTFVKPEHTQPERGSFFVTGGRIFPVGTIDGDGATFDPNKSGHIGIWICRGTHLVAANEIPAAPLWVDTAQLYVLGRQGKEQLATEGVEGGGTVTRIVTGGTGNFAGWVNASRTAARKGHGPWLRPRLRVARAPLTMRISRRGRVAVQETDRRRLARAVRPIVPRGFADADLLDEIAPAGWEHSPLLACFDPSVERLFEEHLLMHRKLEELRRMRRRPDTDMTDASSPEPTLDDVRREYEPSPVKQDEEVTELVGLCLWDIFSDNHEVIAADGRLVDIGSFRGAGAFLDEHVNRDGDRWREGDYLRFYLGTIWITRRADLAPVYAMIFRRLKALGADWVYHFPELGIVELTPPDDPEQPATKYSVSQGAVAELKAQQRRAELQRFVRSWPR